MNTSLYERDFYAWSSQQAALLRAGRLGEADIANIAEEIAAVGRNEVRTLDSHLIHMIEHLLKLHFSPAVDPRRGWQESVSVHRLEARMVLRDNPSLKRRINLDELYADARTIAVTSLALHDGLPASMVPEQSPWTLAQLLDNDFWPEPVTRP